MSRVISDDEIFIFMFCYACIQDSVFISKTQTQRLKNEMEIGDSSNSVHLTNWLKQISVLVKQTIILSQKNKMLNLWKVSMSQVSCGDNQNTTIIDATNGILCCRL